MNIYFMTTKGKNTYSSGQRLFSYEIHKDRDEIYFITKRLPDNKFRVKIIVSIVFVY